MIISEIIMFLAVILSAAILALLVSGYWVNSDFKVERNGMLQISSVPTGATIEIDDQSSSWLERTNSSKLLNSGEHTIKLSKDGYDTWSKTINIVEGLLYRLHYPRLFLQDRTTESILSTSTYTGATVSPDRNSLILFNNTTEWGYINLDVDGPVIKKLDVSKLFSSVSLAENAKVGLFSGEILSFDWDYDSSHILMKVQSGESVEWALLDVHNVDKSINLTKEFSANFSEIRIIDNNSNNLLAIQDGNLRKIDTPGRLISAVLVKSVYDYDHFNNEIVFSATSDSFDQADTKYYVGYFKLGDSKITKLEETTSPAKVAISKFYDEKYITTVREGRITVHKKESYDSEPKEFNVAFTPDRIKTGFSGEFIVFSDGKQMAALDMEANTIREWAIEETHNWLDNCMLYAVSDGELIVYDFDGLNRRVLAKNVSSHFPVTITSDKWLYYFSDGNLVREWLVGK